MKHQNYTVKNVPPKVKKAISDYCKEHGIFQCKFLADDKRLKKYLE